MYKTRVKFESSYQFPSAHLVKMNLKGFAVVTLTVLSVLVGVNSQMALELQLPVAKFKTDLLAMKTTGVVDGPTLITDLESIKAVMKSIPTKAPAQAVTYLDELIVKIRGITASGSVTPDQVLDAVQATKSLIKKSFKDAGSSGDMKL